MTKASSTHALPLKDRLIVLRQEKRGRLPLLLLLLACLLSVLFHVAAVGAMFFINSAAIVAEAPDTPPVPPSEKNMPIKTDPPEEPARKDPFFSPDVDIAALDVEAEPVFKDHVSEMPGLPSDKEDPGNADRDATPFSPPAIAGFGDKGTLAGAFGTGLGPGTAGGFGLRGAPLPGGFEGRSGEARERALREGGGTSESEAAVRNGLRWLKYKQTPEGKWMLDGDYPDKGLRNDVAGTAFGLLPFLASGKTHEKSADNEFHENVANGLKYLLRRQDKRTGYFGGGMYAHGLATITVCEAYGLSRDPSLRKPAEMAVKYIVDTQHVRGGWRYSPGQPGDMSVVGWQVMALKSAQMAHADAHLPDGTIQKAVQFLDSCCNEGTEGYGYIGKSSPTPTMSAVGLLCRQYLQYWGPNNPRMAKGVENNLKTKPPGTLQNIYYYYYATQVMHHYGGADWKNWNVKMRDQLVSSQVKEGSDAGSWDSTGDAHGPSGGRLMQTSLSLLTLEVYYRHLPLFSQQSIIYIGGR